MVVDVDFYVGIVEFFVNMDYLLVMFWFFCGNFLDNLLLILKWLEMELVGF